jgi:hypothetical protein
MPQQREAPEATRQPISCLSRLRFGLAEFVRFFLYFRGVLVLFGARHAPMVPM